MLVVEDDRGIREAVSDMLREEGFSVNTAEDGRAALHALDGQSDLPPLILVDLMMPTMGGHELVRQLKANPKYATIPVVLMTAVPAVLGVDPMLRDLPVLEKPFSVGALLGMVRRVLQSGSA